MRTKLPRNVENPHPIVPKDLDAMQHPFFKDKELRGDFDEISRPFSCKTVFNETFMQQVYYLAKGGFRNEDLAEFFKVSGDTINSWISKKEGFAEALHEGRWMFSLKVSETLGQRALGYDYTETETAEHVTRAGDIVTLTKKTHKHMPPDVTAIIFYLKNRQRDLWQDVNRTEIDARFQVNVSKSIETDEFSEEERKLLKSIAIKKIIPIHGQSING